MWVSHSFYYLQDQTKDAESTGKIDLYFKSARDKSILRINFDYNNGFKLIIQHDRMEIVGEIVQDMCAFMGIKDFASEADFPQEMDNFKQSLEAIQSLSDNSVSHVTNLTDDVTNLKVFMVQVEDARSVDNMELMR